MPWRGSVLELWVRADDATGSPLARAARADLAEFLETESPSFPGAAAEAAPGKAPAGR